MAQTLTVIGAGHRPERACLSLFRAKPLFFFLWTPLTSGHVVLLVRGSGRTQKATHIVFYLPAVACLRLESQTTSHRRRNAPERRKQQSPGAEPAPGPRLPHTKRSSYVRRYMKSLFESSTRQRDWRMDTPASTFPVLPTTRGLLGTQSLTSGLRCSLPTPATAPPRRAGQRWPKPPRKTLGERPRKNSSSHRNIHSNRYLLFLFIFFNFCSHLLCPPSLHLLDKYVLLLAHVSCIP